MSDYKKMNTEQLEFAANAGNVEAQFHLGLRYRSGKAVDYKKAVEWYEKAAEQGHVNAQNNLGIIYYKGEVAEQNYEKAFKWWEKAAKQGWPEAQNNLGVMYSRGKGVEKDIENATTWIKISKVVEKDIEKAFEWIEKAAKQGLAEAQHNLGDIYYYGKGVDKDIEKAVELWKQAAEQGNADSINTLGRVMESLNDEFSSSSSVEFSNLFTGKAHADKKLAGGIYEFLKELNDSRQTAESAQTAKAVPVPPKTGEGGYS